MFLFFFLESTGGVFIYFSNNQNKYERKMILNLVLTNFFTGQSIVTISEHE